MYTSPKARRILIYVRRTQIYIDEDLDRDLRRLAAAEGRSAAAVIRDAIRAYLSHRADGRGEPDPILAMAGALSGLPPDAALEHDRDVYVARSEGRPRRLRK